MNPKIDNNKYQVFICGSRAHLPFFFASHSWIVINKKGVVNRWEILYNKNCCDKSVAEYLHVDRFSIDQGMSIFSFWNKFSWKSRIIGFIEGDVNSIAKKVIDFVEESKDTYPYTKKYVLTGPNSNTYTQWILNKFPELNIKLPWNFIGKDYNKSI